MFIRETIRNFRILALIRIHIRIYTRVKRVLLTVQICVREMPKDVREYSNG